MRLLSKGFQFFRGDREVVVASDLDVMPGTITVIMGDSGVGKSSLCHAVVRARREAMVFQDSGGLQHLTVRENLSLALSGRHRHTSRLDRKCKIQAAEGRFGLSGSTKAEDLSGGERRRLAVACSLVSEPAVVWIDEPDAGCDRTRVEQLAAILREAVNQSRPPVIVLITHNPSFAALVQPTQIVRVVSETMAGTGMLLLKLPLHHMSSSAAKSLTGADVLSIIETLDSDAAQGEHSSPPIAANRRARRYAPSSLGRSEGRSGLAQWTNLAITTLSACFCPAYDAIARRTLVATLRMSAWASAPYYLLVGVATGLIFLITLFLIPHLTEIWLPDALVAAVSPHLLVRAAPAVAAVLIAASAGSLVASWVGQMQARLDLDAFRLLQADVDRRVLAPAVIGLAGGVLVGTLLFSTAMAASFLVFLAKWSGDAIGAVDEFYSNLGALWTGIPFFEAGVGSNLVLGAAGEMLLYAAFISLTAVDAATKPFVTSQASVPYAIRHAIVRSSLGVIILKALILMPHLVGVG